MSLRTLFRWHLWLGLITGLGLVFVGFTGAVAVFAMELERMAVPALRMKEVLIDAPATVDTLVFELRAAHPTARIVSLTLAQEDGFAHSARLQFTQPGGKPRQLDVYLNPNSGAIQGEREFGEGYTASLYQFIRQSHVRLLLGFWGRVFVGVLGVTLVLSCVTGLWIYRGWLKKLFTLNLRGGWRGRAPWAELHKFVGVWSLIFNVLIGLTGAVLGLENLSNKAGAVWFNAGPLAPKPPAPPPTRGEPQPVGVLLAKARAALPDLTVRTIVFPAQPGASIVFRGGVGALLVADSHVRSASSVRLDSVTGAVLAVVDGRTLGFWPRLYWMQDPLHFGYFGGLATKIIWFILGLTPGVLALTGTWMWWRRRARATRPAASPSSALAEGWGVAWSVPVVIGALALVAGYAVAATAQKSWAFTPLLAEHWLVKPVSLACAAFPVTALLAWLIYAVRARSVPLAGATLLGGAWFVLLVKVFPA